ncbi:MAG: hypothetical protein UHK52_08295 [Bacteroidales bacterium]|nr:hypothetical protein [Bacteroidales bacterium]
MIRKKLFALVLFVCSFCGLYAQVLSPSTKQDIISQFNKHIKTISSISSENFDLMSVYKYQLEQAEEFMKKQQVNNFDNDIYAKNLELKLLIEQNSEIVEFMIPRMSDWYYKKAVFANLNNKKQEAYNYLLKSVEADSMNVMANYELAKISLDSFQVSKTTERLTRLLQNENLNKEESQLCKNLLAFTYDKNIITSLALVKEGKFSDAEDILLQLQSYCKNDILNICKPNLIEKNINICKNGIYKDHIKIAKTAVDKQKTKVAGDFLVNTYDYLQRNMGEITDTSDFDDIVKIVVGNYLATAKGLTEAKNNEARIDLIHKAKELASMLGGDYETDILKQIAMMQGTTNTSDPVLDSLENAAPNTGYADKYPEFVKDTTANVEKEIEKIEEKFVYVKVNNYEKAVEVLEKTNELPSIKSTKNIGESNISAIREVTAKRMHKAEYAIFQDDIITADSLVDITEKMLSKYNMKNDSVVVKIMNNYLRAIDQRVCQKKQEEVDVMVHNILDCIRKNDFYLAEEYINIGMQIKGSSECKLNKQRLRALKRQIEQPLEYVKTKEGVDELLAQGDTARYLKEYAALEHFYITHSLREMSVQHKPIKDIIYEFGSDQLAINTIENLMKYRQYEQGVEALAALKEFGYKSRHTKKIQKQLGQMMSLEESKRNDKIAQSNRLMDKYGEDRWFKYLIKSYNKNLIKWNKQHRGN